MTFLSKQKNGYSICENTQCPSKCHESFQETLENTTYDYSLSTFIFFFFFFFFCSRLSRMKKENIDYIRVWKPKAVVKSYENHKNNWRIVFVVYELFIAY